MIGRGANRVDDTGMAMAAKEKEGLVVRAIDTGQFSDFARRHGKSDEIGPIATYLDDAKKKDAGGKPWLFGLYGCDALCAVTCCLVSRAVEGDWHTIKLDSIIVDQSLRRRGLGSVLVARAFSDIIREAEINVSHIYAHSVHPATVRLLRALAFNDPQPKGAPLSSIQFDDGGEEFLRQCDQRIQALLKNLRLHCNFCRKGDRRTRRWCPDTSPVK